MDDLITAQEAAAVGFDRATRRYSVNQNVGVLRNRGDPYQIQLALRILT